MDTENLVATIINALMDARRAGAFNADQIQEMIEFLNAGIEASGDGFLLVTDDGREFHVTVTEQR